MKYISLFNNDYRLIIAGVIALLIIFVGFVISIFGSKIKYIKKWYSRKRMISIMFVIGFIFGFIIACINNFKIFDSDDSESLWIKNLIYLSSSFVRLTFSIMFVGFLFSLPFRLFTNFYMFSRYRNPMKKIMKISFVYFGFGGIALLVSCLQYLFKDSFFAFSSSFSYQTGNINPESYPTIYYICDYLLSVALQIRKPIYSIGLLITLLIIIIFEILFIKLMNFYRPKTLDKIVKKIDKISKTTDIFSCFSPVFAFSGIAVSLMVQTIATFLRISVVLLLVAILSVVIIMLNFSYTMITRSIKFNTYKTLMVDAAKYVLKNQLSDDGIKHLSNAKSFRGFKDFNNDQNIYNIFLTTIYPLIITSYLGFSSGPLFNPDLKPLYHAFYFIFLYIFGYIFMFAYAFKYSDVLPYKVMLWSATPYIRSGFNTSILLFFNNMINKAAFYATYSTFIAVACKHDRHFRKMII